MSGDRILMTFLLFMVSGVFGPIRVTDKQWLCHYCSMGESLSGSTSRQIRCHNCDLTD